MIFALDSNIITALIKKDRQVEERLKQAVDNNHQYVVPPIVYYEVKRWLVLKNATAQLAIFERFCRFSPGFSIEQPCLERAIEIYADLIKRGKPVGDFDIIIAAFCIVNPVGDYDCPVIARLAFHRANLRYRIVNGVI